MWAWADHIPAILVPFFYQRAFAGCPRQIETQYKRHLETRWHTSGGGQLGLPEGVTHSSRGATRFYEVEDKLRPDWLCAPSLHNRQHCAGQCRPNVLGILPAASSDWARCEDLVETTLRKAPQLVKGYQAHCARFCPLARGRDTRQRGHRALTPAGARQCDSGLVRAGSAGGMHTRSVG